MDDSKTGEADPYILEKDVGRVVSGGVMPGWLQSVGPMASMLEYGGAMAGCEAGPFVWEVSCKAGPCVCKPSSDDLVSWRPTAVNPVLRQWPAR